MMVGRGGRLQEINERSALVTWLSSECLHSLFHWSVYVSGRIDSSEIQQSLAELGIGVSGEDALKILQRFDLHFLRTVTCVWLQCV